MAKADSWEGGTEVQSNWFKFEEVGDKIKGTLVEKRHQEGSEGFSDQKVYVLQTEEGLYNVGIAVTKMGTVQRLQSCKLGEIVGIVFDSEGDAPKKGFHKAKFLKVITFGMDPNYDSFSGGEEVAAPAEPALPPM